MFQKMRRADRELSKAEVATILKNGEYGVLSTIGADGYPYGVPVSYVYVDSKIYFHCAGGVGHKLDNINRCAKVCFTVVGKTEIMPEDFSTKYESVIAFGTASKVVGEKQTVLEVIILKYAPDFKEAGLKLISKAIDKTDIYEIKIEHMTGKARKK